MERTLCSETVKNGLTKIFSLVIYLIIFVIFILIPFAPHMYVKVQESLNSSKPLGTTDLIGILDPVAIGTIILALATFVLVRDSSNNIKISKNNLVEEHLVNEMENLIKPIYMQKDRFEYLENVHIRYYDETRDYQRWQEESNDFWELLEANRYLASKDLRELIKDYSESNRGWEIMRRALANQVEEALIREGKRGLCQEAPRDRFLEDISPGYFDYIFINLPLTQEKTERKQRIKELTNQLEQSSDSFIRIEEFVSLIDEDTVLEEMRTRFKKEVIDRYEKLEKKIDKIREALDKSS